MLLSCHWFPLPSTCFCTSLNQSICSCSRHDCSVSMLRLSSAGCELSVESREPRERCLIFSWLVDVDCVCMLSEVVETRECFPTMTIERSFTSVLPTKVAREEEWGRDNVSVSASKKHTTRLYICVVYFHLFQAEKETAHHPCCFVSVRSFLPQSLALLSAFSSQSSGPPIWESNVSRLVP